MVIYLNSLILSEVSSCHPCITYVNITNLNFFLCFFLHSDFACFPIFGFCTILVSYHYIERWEKHVKILPWQTQRPHWRQGCRLTRWSGSIFEKWGLKKTAGLKWLGIGSHQASVNKVNEPSWSLNVTNFLTG